MCFKDQRIESKQCLSVLLRWLKDILTKRSDTRKPMLIV